MGGCGKTTLAMELMNKKRDLFDKVLFVPVSSTTVVRRIQDKIASSLQFQFPESEETERARRLHERLIQENKILLILDDVWEILDFGTIGIPSSTTHRGCKVLITTRSEAVCTSMDCQRKISLPILEEGEAWALFQKQALLSEGTSDTLKDLARNISVECKGLPVALAAVASTLKGKSEVDWKVALNRLRSSKPVNIAKGLQDPYNCLQLSYDNLDTEEAKSLFLLCSVYPEDYEIPVGELTRYAIGLGLGGGEVHSYEVARNEFSATKNKLISSCLLLGGTNYQGEYVKMHDLVRDVAIWISKEHNKNSSGNYSPRYQWSQSFPEEWDVSNLEFLRIFRRLNVSDEIFKRMGKLRVLVLINVGDRRLPFPRELLKSLTNLRSLFLKKWQLSDLSFLEDMKKLESLDLDDCSFVELPNDVAAKQLKNLRLLWLNKCYVAKKNFEAIARLQQLEELYIVDDQFSSEWDHYSKNVAEFFNESSVVQKLKRYVIRGGNVRYPDSEMKEGNILHYKSVSLGYYHTSYAAVKVLAKRAECLVLANMLGCSCLKNIIPDMIEIERGGGSELKVIMISHSNEMEYLIDTTNHLSKVGNILPELRVLQISYMNNFTALSHGHLPPSGPFRKLEELAVLECPELTSLFTPEVARSLVELRKLKIEHCDGLKHILVDDDTEEISSDDNKLVFSKLEHIIVYCCEQLEYIIPATFAQGLLQLEHLDISRCDELRYVFGQNIHGNQGPNELEINLPALKGVSLDELPQAISIVPYNCYLRWPSMQWFHLQGCWKFATLSIKTCRKIENQCDHNKREDFGLENVPQMQYICMSFKDPSNFKNLEILTIFGCEKVEVIFPACVSRCLSELKVLFIRECKGLKVIVKEDMENETLSDLPSQRTQPCFPKLEALIVDECHKLKRLISVYPSNDLPNLKILIINRASELEELIGSEQGKGNVIGEKKVEFPELKCLMFTRLSSLCQGIESPNIRHRLVHNCPKLSLSSTTTLEEFKKQVSQGKDLGCSMDISSQELTEIFDSVEAPSEAAQTPSGSESPSQVSSNQSTLSASFGVAQINEGSEKEFVGEVSGSKSIDEIETKRADNGKDPSLVKPAIPSSVSDLREPSPTSVTTSVHKIPMHNQVDQEPTSEPGVLDEQHALGETLSMEEIGKEKIQEGPAPKETMMKTLSSGVEGITFGREVPNLMNNEDRVGIPPDTHGSHTVNIAKLGSYKYFVDMDDAQIAVLLEAIAAYPHLWNVCEKFSERFQAWMLKTLVDMLWFLRNESPFSVTPTREKEFRRLCDEAVQLGFDISWVDGMRQRVIVKDPKVEHSQARRNELLKRHDQLTQQLGEIKDEINSLNDFLAAQKKCFDFL